MKPLKRIFAALTVMIIVTMIGCKKDDPGNGYMAVKMTEEGRPGGETPDALQVTAVKLEITSVEVHYTNESAGNSGWIMLNTNAGIYNLFTLQNGIAATIAAETQLPVGDINQIRVRLGANNSVFLGRTNEYFLMVPSEYSSGIRINANASVSDEERMAITLSIDATQSVVMEDRTFKLRPVITVKSITKY